MPRPRFIGLTGPNAAGKGEAADHLRDAHGYAVRSLSDVLRRVAAERGLEPVRSVLIELGNEQRRERGPGALAELILPELSSPTVIDSIRNPTEVEVLRRLPGFVLLAVTAPAELRFRRSRSRRRPGDPETLAEFEERERQENTSNPAAQQLDATQRLADHVIVNEEPLAALHGQLDFLLERLERNLAPDEEVDALGLLCPLPVLRADAAMKRLEPGQLLLLRADDEGVRDDVPAWCEGNGHELLTMTSGCGPSGREIHLWIRRSA